jgi:protein phosphatase 1 regulatory subunit 7
MLPQIRINDPETLDLDYIGKELTNSKHVIVQFSKPIYSEKQISQLNIQCAKYDDNFGVRFYGHYSSSFDFKILRKIPNVKCLYVDCLTYADNIQVLTELTQLKKLSLGVFELTDFEILNSENLQKLTELILTETRSKALNLDYLKYYKNLKFLIIGEHTKNIEAVGELSNLEYLSLNSIKKTPVPFVNKLKKLKTLKFILGGRENIVEIEDNDIETLEIVWVRSFNNLSNISNFKKLKNLLIEDNIQLQKIHFDKVLPNLEDLKILNCKTLNSLTGLESLTSLQQLRIYKTNLDFENILIQKLPPTLKTFAFYTTKKKEDEKIKVILKERGFNEWT